MGLVHLPFQSLTVSHLWLLTLLYLSLRERGPCSISERWVVCFHLCVGELFFFEFTQAIEQACVVL